MNTLANSELIVLIQSVADGLRKQWDRELRAYDPQLSAARARVIVQLGRSGGVSQTRLARLLRQSQMTVSRLIDAIEAHGWIEREPMPADRRSWAVRLTDEGKRALSVIHAARRNFLQRSCAALGDERSAILSSGLAVLASGARPAAASRPQATTRRNSHEIIHQRTH